MSLFELTDKGKLLFNLTSSKFSHIDDEVYFLATLNYDEKLKKMLTHFNKDTMLKFSNYFFM